MLSVLFTYENFWNFDVMQIHKIGSGKYTALYKILYRKAQEHGLSFTSYGELDYTSFGSSIYPTMRIAPKDERQYESLLLLISGFHGEEKEGPLTLSDYFDEIYGYADKHGVGVIMYPCVNPSGFDYGRRYSFEYDPSKHRGNNDFLRYVFNDGSIGSGLLRKQSFKKWYIASNSYILNLLKNLPEDEHYELLKDTLLLHKAIYRDLSVFKDRIIAFVDLHQDFILDVSSQPYSYIYTFGDTIPYLATIAEVGHLVPILRNHRINSGFSDDDFYSDKHGVLMRHEGTIEDYMYRMGIPHVICVETTGAVTSRVARDVNRLWIQCAIRLAAGK